MTSIFYQWHFSVSSIILLCVLCGLYFYICRAKPGKKLPFFILALICIIVAVASPLKLLGDSYLFSAHMTSHVILVLIAGPLLTASLPKNNRFHDRLVSLSKKLNKHPLIGWLCGVGIMWLWHVPVIFNSMMSAGNMSASPFNMQIIMLFHDCSLLLAGILFSWPVISPYKTHRINPLTSVLYLSSACVFCSLLGLMITFAPAGTYTDYIMTGNNQTLSLIRNQWKISAYADQQIAGLIMWVPCCFVYLSASMILLIKWFARGDSGVCQLETEELSYAN